MEAMGRVHPSQRHHRQRYQMSESARGLHRCDEALISARPHGLHSLDPQGGVDLAEVKARVGKKVCLLGNVNCALLQTGTEDEVVSEVRRALREGMPGGVRKEHSTCRSKDGCGHLRIGENIG